jgi:hypothetical protein
MQHNWQGFLRARKQVCKCVGRDIAALGLVDELAYRDKSVFNQLGMAFPP